MTETGPTTIMGDHSGSTKLIVETMTQTDEISHSNMSLNCLVQLLDRVRELIGDCEPLSVSYYPTAKRQLVVHLTCDDFTKQFAGLFVHVRYEREYVHYSMFDDTIEVTTCRKSTDASLVRVMCPKAESEVVV